MCRARFVNPGELGGVVMCQAVLAGVRRVGTYSHAAVCPIMCYSVNLLNEPDFQIIVL